MSITPKQLAANRQNAQKSTGPKSHEGKANSASNATTHGLYCTDTVINSPYLKENQEEYDALLTGLVAELNPAGALENQMVNSIANCLWRLNRAMNAETAHLNQQLTRQAENSLPHHTTNPTDTNPNNTENTLTQSELDEISEITELAELTTRATANSIPSGLFSKSLLRYEMRLEIRLTRAFKTLTQLKRLRQSSQKRESPKKPK